MEASGQIHNQVALPPGKQPPFPLHRGWLGPIAGMDIVEKRNISCPGRKSNSGRPARSRTLYRLSYTGSFQHLSACIIYLGDIMHITVHGKVALMPQKNIGIAEVKLPAILT
jgi:hypothetical protein